MPARNGYATKVCPAKSVIFKSKDNSETGSWNERKKQML